MRASLANKIFVVIFLMLISAPLLMLILGDTKTVSVSEKRELKTWVRWKDSESTAQFFSNVSDYVQDHFGFRDDLISLNAKMLVALKQSPVDKVIIGKDNWLFYKTYDALSLASFDKAKIIAAIERRARHVSYRAQVLADRGIAYTYVVAPNKMVMYLENMPSIYVLSENNRMYGLFSSELDSSGIKFHFDLQHHLIQQKKHNPKFDFYYKNDTHWNHYGAYIAYQGIVSFINQRYPNIELSPASYSFIAKEKVGGDLAKFIGLDNALVAIEPSAEFPECARAGQVKAIRKGILQGQCKLNETKIVFIGDSFRTNLYPFVAESSGTVFMVSQGISHKKLDNLIERVQPDLVIEEIVQRNLGKPLPY